MRAVAAATAGAAVHVALFALDERGTVRWRAGGRPLGSLCAFRALTGRRCPGCGMTRASVLLRGGRPVAATRANPAVWLVAGLAVQGMVRSARAARPGATARSAAVQGRGAQSASAPA